MSAWDRLPAEYRKLCEEVAGKHNLSPQSRRIRAAVDAYLANQRKA